MSQIPEPWATAIVKAGFTDPRYSDDRPSLGALAEEAGVHTTTVSRMVYGRGRAKQPNIAAVAKALRRDVVEVSAWVRQARTESEPYRPPAEADLLTGRERRALDQLILAIAETRKVSESDDETSNRHASGSEAQESELLTGTGELLGEPPEEEANPGPGRGGRRSGPA